MIQSVQLRGNWVAVVEDRSIAGVENFIRCLTRAASGMGFPVTYPLEVYVKNDFH